MTEGDEEVISWAGKVTHLAQTDEVEFIHKVEVPELPGRAKEKYPWLLQPLNGMVQDQMETQVRNSWTGREGCRIKFRVEERGNVVLAILSAILEQGSDLVVVGQEGYGRDIAVRLARKAPCSVMTIPSGCTVKLERIGVPTDFSNYSSGALDVGLAFAEAGGVKQIDSVHIYNLGRFSHRVALPEDELRDMAEQYAEEKHEEYIARQDLSGIQVNQVNTFHPMVSTGIMQAIKSLESDLVVTGCRGRDTLTAWLLGGNAEQLLKQSPIPVVAAKPKGTGQKLLEALLSD